MSKALDELGGKCPYMPFLGRGQMSEGAHVRPPHTLVFLYKNGDSGGTHCTDMFPDEWKTHINNRLTKAKRTLETVYNLHITV